MSPELRWLASRPLALREFEGKWVVLVDERVVASGDSPKEVMEALPEQYRGRGLLHRITRRDFDPNAIVIA